MQMVPLLFAQQSEVSWTGAVLLILAITALFAASGWVVIWIARRTASGQLGRNGWSGIRTSATQSSDEAWLVAHQAGEGPTVAAGWICVAGSVISAVVALLLGNSPDEATTFWAIGVTVTTVLLLGLVLYGARLGHLAAKSVQSVGGSAS